METHDHELRFATSEDDELVTLILEQDCPRCAEIAERYVRSQS